MMRNSKASVLRMYILVCMVCFTSLAVLQIFFPVSAEESFTAYCYRDNKSIGSAVVYENSNSAEVCNSLYFDCKGKCIACFHDFDYVDYVCVDTSGRTFLR